jgi:hypothetical protein
MLLRKSFTRDQIEECLEEYSLLNVWQVCIFLPLSSIHMFLIILLQVNGDRTQLTFVDEQRD